MWKEIIVLFCFSLGSHGKTPDQVKLLLTFSFLFLSMAQDNMIKSATN